MSSWMTLTWLDPRLSWSPNDYADIKSIHVSIDYIWRPHLYLYNAHISAGSGKWQWIIFAINVH